MAVFDSVNANVGITAGGVPPVSDVTFPGIPQRRLYAFGDRVAELSPEESPFFVYLSNVAKSPTSDSVFKVLENRSSIDWTNRTGTVENLTAAFTPDLELTNIAFDGAASSHTGGVGVTLIAGMVLMIDRVDGDGKPIPVIVQLNSAGVGGAGYWDMEILENSGDAATDIAASASYQVIGTSFEEGGSAPAFWSTGIDDTFGQTQIFKTSCYMTGTAMATTYRGYASEWDRIWNLKLREHKVDIERALLFGQKSRVTGGDTKVYQQTDGIIGYILRNVGTGANYNTDASAGDLDYVAGKPYVRESAYSVMTYDRFLGDLEVMFDPARGGSYGKLCLAGLPTITFFNKVGSAGFLQQSISSTNAHMNFELEPRQGAFGHKVLTIDTIHGQLNLVKDPLLRGMSQNWMACVDLNNVKYRPLVGNGQNRDTHIITNVQTPDEDSRKDQILTEAGLEVTLPETHALYCFS